MVFHVFEANKFSKINNQLSIPDTIPEQSGELSLSSSKLSDIKNGN